MCHLRSLTCKVEEVHTTLRKHLSKEEQQLLPLLLQHFSHAEQAELVAQFLYCIPLAMVGRVMAWIQPMVPHSEMQQLLAHLRNVIPDRLMLQLLEGWLNPQQRQAGCAGAGVPTSDPAYLPIPMVEEVAPQGAAAGHADPQEAASDWPPLRAIILIHGAIRSALEAFVAESEVLQAQQDVDPAQISTLVERHRFLRSICHFHALSEEEVRAVVLGCGCDAHSLVTMAFAFGLAAWFLDLCACRPWSWWHGILVHCCLLRPHVSFLKLSLLTFPVLAIGLPAYSGAARG